MGVAKGLEAAWDACVRHRQRHARKYTALGIVLVFLPTEEIGKWIWSQVPSATQLLNWFSSVRFPDFSWWNLTTTPIGVLLLLLLWRDSRRSRRGLATSGEQWEEEALADLHDAEELNREIERNQTLQDYPKVVAERDALRTALEETQQDRERIRGGLGASERSVKECKKQFALARVRWFAERVRTNIAAGRERGEQIQDVRVTVRFAEYADFDLAQEIKRLISEHTHWPVEIERATNPVLPPADEFKVIFESGAFGTYREVANAFDEGQLIPASVGVRNRDRFDQEHLIVDVLPTVPKPSL